MTNTSLQTIDIRRIHDLSPVIDEYSLGDDFIIGEVSGKKMEKSTALLNMLKYPFRFDGYIIFFLRKGHFTIDFNLNSYEVHENSLLVAVPGNIVRLAQYKEDRVGDAELIFTLISKEFMSQIRFDFIQAFKDSLRLLDNPCITLTPEQLEIATDYFNLSRKVVMSSVHNKREIVGGLLTSLSYMAVDVWKQQVEDARENTSGSSARVNQIFERFLSLVQEFHTTERGMAFYADKICLTPKYLSKLVKQASGRSAPEWIDAYVILEAKNLLKYSNMTIKEIVYHLHFPNQSVFYKYFKAHTGMTPSEYRKG